MVKYSVSQMVKRQSQENGQRFHQYRTMTARLPSVHVTLMELISLLFVRMRQFISEVLTRKESLEKHVRKLELICMHVCVFVCVGVCVWVCVCVHVFVCLCVCPCDTVLQQWEFLHLL